MNDAIHPAKLHAPAPAQVAESPKLAIYGFGAFGIKTCSRTPTQTNTRISYVDTSEANLTKDFDAAKCYRIPVPPKEGERERGGAGQDRRRIAAAALPHIGKILEKFVPGEFNVLIFSCSGGSGSVVGPLVARELEKRGETVFIITVGELSTTKYLTNTRDTWKTMENISINLGKPLVMSYFENAPGVPPSAIDQDVQFVIEALTALATQHNEDLDGSDLYNWINFNNVTSVQPQLACATITDNRKAANAVLEPITTLSLFANRDDYIMVGTPHYGKAGYPMEPLVAAYEELHFIINTISVDEISKRLKEAETTQQQTHAGYRRRASLVSPKDDDMIDDCIVVS